MMYPYMKFEDETEVTFSQIILTNDIETVEVHFERPTKKTALIQQDVVFQVTLG